MKWSPLYLAALTPFAFLSSGVLFGHTVVLMDKWTPESMLQLIDKYRVTNSHMVPTQFHRLLALPDDVKATYEKNGLSANFSACSFRHWSA